MPIDLGDNPVGTPPTEEQKLQIRKAIGSEPIDIETNDPITDGVNAPIHTDAISPDGTHWIKVGELDTDWEKRFISTSGVFEVNVSLGEVEDAEVLPENGIGIRNGNVVYGDGATLGGRGVGDQYWPQYTTFINSDNTILSAYLTEITQSNRLLGPTALKGLVIGSGVTAIRQNAFYALFEDGTAEGRLIIPDTVQIIEDGAFFGQTSFTGPLVIPNNVTLTGSNHFRIMRGITSIHLPTSIPEIPNGSFSGLSGLTSGITIPPFVTSIGIGSFEISNIVGDLIIPSNVKTIGVNAFFAVNCNGNLILESGIEVISSSAFAAELGQTSGWTGDLIIPDTVTFVGNAAFTGAVNLNNVYVNRPASIFESGAFNGFGSGPTNNLYVTSTHIDSFGGAGATYEGMTVALWTSYPNIMS